MSAVTVASSIVSSLLNATTSVASLRARVLERTASFLRLSQKFEDQSKTLDAYARLKGGSLSAADQARLIAAQNAVAQGRSRWQSANTLLSSVTAALQSPNATSSAQLVTAIPQLISGMTIVQQLADANDRLIAQLVGGLSSDERAHLTTSTGVTVAAGVSVGLLLVIGGGIWYLSTRNRS